MEKLRLEGIFADPAIQAALKAQSEHGQTKKSPTTKNPTGIP